MFTNLIRINTLKYRKGNFFKWGVAITFAVMVAFCVIYCYMYFSPNPSDYFGTVDDVSDMDMHMSFWLITMMCAELFYALCNIILVCDHYSNREIVNIGGVVRSPVKWTASELIAALIYAPFFGIVPIVATDVFTWYNGIDNVVFTSDIVKTLLFILFTSLYLWFSSFSAIFFAKLTRRIGYAFLLCFITDTTLNIFLSLLTDPLARMLRVSSDATDDLASELSNPNVWVLSYITGTGTSLDKIRFVIYYTLFFLIGISAILLVSRRREEK